MRYTAHGKLRFLAEWIDAYTFPKALGFDANSRRSRTRFMNVPCIFPILPRRGDSTQPKNRVRIVKTWVRISGPISKRHRGRNPHPGENRRAYALSSILSALPRRLVNWDAVQMKEAQEGLRDACYNRTFATPRADLAG